MGAFQAEGSAWAKQGYILFKEAQEGLYGCEGPLHLLRHVPEGQTVRSFAGCSSPPPTPIAVMEEYGGYAHGP